MDSRGLDYFVLTIVIIGAINWGLIGFFGLDLISWLFGSMSLLSRIIYGVVGICGLYMLSVFGRITSMSRAQLKKVYENETSRNPCWFF